MDLSSTIIPDSSQLNADDLMSGPVTVTIEKVTRGGDEQPVDIHLVEFPGRAFRPSKSMRRVLVMAWGKESSAYIGRRLTLYRDPEITFGREKVGGIRISHMSDIDKRLVVALTVTRGKRTPFAVQPLPADTPSAPRTPPPGDAEPTPDYMALARESGSAEGVRAVWRQAKDAGRLDDDLNASLMEVAQQLEADVPTHKFLYGDDPAVCAECGQPEDADAHGGRA